MSQGKHGLIHNETTYIYSYKGVNIGVENTDPILQCSHHCARVKTVSLSFVIQLYSTEIGVTEKHYYAIHYEMVGTFRVWFNEIES